MLYNAQENSNKSSIYSCVSVAVAFTTLHKALLKSVPLFYILFTHPNISKLFSNV